MLDKLKVDYDLAVNYLRLGFFSNSLLLNKKMYLLYNIFNKKREFFLLKKKERQVGSYFFNYLTYQTMNNNFSNKIEKKFDYFVKWSSSFLNFNDINIKNNIFNLNKKKFFLNTKISLNYMVCDDVFIDYHLNKKKTYLYLNKNMFLFNVLLKLNNKEKMQFKNFFLFDLYNRYNSLNLNYYKIITYKYWNNDENLIYYSKLKIKIKEYILDNLHKYLFLYLNKEKIFEIFADFTLIEPLSYLKKIQAYNILRTNYINNYNKNFFFKFLKKSLFYQSNFNKIFFRYKKKFMVNFLKKKFLPLISLNILKNLKKRNILNILKKKKINNKIFFSRNFYILKKFLPNLHLKETLKKLRRKLKKKHNFRLIRKLKKFNYISGRSTLTRQQVYRRFKSKIIRKLKTKKTLKKKHFYLKSSKYRFNLFVYNNRNGYRNRMKAKELKLLISPRYFYSNNKPSDYRDIEKLEKGLNWAELPDNIMSKFRKKWVKKNNLFSDDFYLYKNKKINDLIFLKNYRQWKKKKNNNYTFLQYKKFIIRKKKKEKIKKVKEIFFGFNRQFNVSKHSLWLFQKMFIFLKNINIIRTYNNSYLIKNYYHNYKIIYNHFFFLIINILRMFSVRYLYEKKKKWFIYIKKIKKIFYFLKILLNFSYINKKNKVLKNVKILKKLKKLKQRKKKVKTPLPSPRKKKVKTPPISIPKKVEAGFLTIYEKKENLKSIEEWQRIINKIPWMTFKDKRIFDKKNKFYLSLIFNKTKKKNFIDWMNKTEIRIKQARDSYKNSKYNTNIKPN